MAAMLAARTVVRSATTGSTTLKALVLLENDPPGWAQQPEMRGAFGQPATALRSHDRVLVLAYLNTDAATIAVKWFCCYHCRHSGICPSANCWRV
jgi:hypothetical protein